MRVAMTGSTGLIGSALAARLEAGGHEVVRIRRGGEDEPGADWDPAGGWVRDGAFAGHDAVVNLSGANIGGGRWSGARRAELRSSRIDLTRALVDLAPAPGPSHDGRGEEVCDAGGDDREHGADRERARGAARGRGARGRPLRSSRIDLTRALVEHLGSLAEGDRPAVLVNQSAVGFYGDRGDAELGEDAGRGLGFLADLVTDWEAEAQRAEDHGIRTVRHRSAIVLSKQGPPLSRMLLPFRLGLGGTLGNGRWWMAWITLEDQLRSLEHAITSELSGAVNAAAPGATTNAQFTKALGRALRRPTLFPIPGFAYKLAFGQDPAELFASQRIVPQALAGSGFEFSHPQIDGALEAVLAA